MPWKETNRMNERERFVRLLFRGSFTMTELCEQFGISRTTGHKLKQRALAEGMAGLAERSRAPKSCPHQTPEYIRELLLEEKRRFPRWGAPKIVQRLRKTQPDVPWPAASTAGELFRKHGLTNPRRKRAKRRHPGRPTRTANEPNELWTIDFKGQFPVGDGELCYPLTVVDLHSRYVLAVDAFPSVHGGPVKKALTKLFKRNGLPRAFRSDNGAPFASARALHGLSALNVWWMELGIHHERTEPSSPQQNGAHERMHKTLKRDTAKPPARSMRTQQRRFDRWVQEFNEERPHEFLDGDMPAERYEPSPRLFPRRIELPDYPDHFIVRKVSTAGTFRISNRQRFLSQPLATKYVGFEEVDDRLWAVHFYDNLIAHYDEGSDRYLE